MKGVVLSSLLKFILFLTHSLSRVRVLCFSRAHTHDIVQVDERSGAVILAYTHTPSLLHTLSLTLRLSLSLSHTHTYTHDVVQMDEGSGTVILTYSHGWI